MKRFTNAVQQSLEIRNWYGALALALTLPDICGRIDNPNLGSQARYERWFSQYLGPVNTSEICGQMVVWLSGAECYALRCSYLHTGGDDITTQRAQETLQQFHFTTMNAHRVRVNGTSLTLNVRMFCSEICRGVEKWVSDRANDPHVAAQVVQLLTIKTEGFSPGPGVEMHVAPDPESV